MDHINNRVRSPRGIVGTTAGPALGLGGAKWLLLAPLAPLLQFQPKSWSGRCPNYPTRRTHRVIDMHHINNRVRSPRGIVGTTAGPALGLVGAK